jgi:hypothetical protein
MQRWHLLLIMQGAETVDNSSVFLQGKLGSMLIVLSIAGSR